MRDYIPRVSIYDSTRQHLRSDSKKQRHGLSWIIPNYHWPSRFLPLSFALLWSWVKAVKKRQPQTQSHVLATDVRIRLEYPATDGIREMLGTEEALNKYYVAISDISVVARCSCHGHSKFCIGPTMAQYCDCQHNTMVLIVTNVIHCLTIVLGCLLTEHMLTNVRVR